jgi:hypothetical protein
MSTAQMSVWLLFPVCIMQLGAQSPTEDLLSKALQHPGDERAVSDVMHTYRDTKDPGVLAKLNELFQRVQQKSLRQGLALFMWATLGQRKDVYFNTLASYANEAVSSDAPLPYFLDPEGNAIQQSEPPVAFTNWCEVHQLAPEMCLKTVSDHALDVRFLALLKDKRAVPIFRKGLSSDNHVVARMSVFGLGLLNDADSFPLIETAIRRFRPQQRPLFVSELAQFDDLRVGPLLDEFIKDSRWRKELDENIRKRHAEPVKQ